MSTFTLPRDVSVIPNACADDKPWVKRFMGYWSRGDRIRSVYLLTDGTCTETVPEPVYDSDGKITTWPEDRVRRYFHGGQFTYEVDAEEATLLEAAGYTIT